MYSEIEKELGRLLNRKIKVKNAYILQFGCTKITPFEEKEDDSDYTIAQLENNFETNNLTEQTGECHKAIVDALKKHPNIHDIQTVRKRDSKISIHGISGSLIAGDVFALEINLPERFHKFKEYRQVIEQFKVISDGSLFAAFSEITDYPIFPHIGHEYREILKKQVDEQTDFFSPSFGPTPIHPDFYIIIEDSLGNGNKSKRPLHYVGDEDEVFIISTSARDEIVELVTFLFLDAEFELIVLYRTILMRNLCMRYVIEIHDEFEMVSSMLGEIHDKKWWQVIQLNKLTQNVKRKLIKIHTLLIAHDRQRHSLNRQRRWLSQCVEKHSMLSHIHSYCIEQTDPDVEVTSTLFPALQFSGEQLRALSNVRAVVIASLVGLLGAGLGALITALLTK